MLPIVQRILPKDLPNRRDDVRRTPRFVVVHDTANDKAGADALMHAQYLENKGRLGEKVSWHYTVDDKRVVQHLPENEPAYHAGDGGNGPGNYWGIGVEICENRNGDRQKAEDNAARLVAMILRRYGWNIDRVHPHKRYSPWGKNCPRHLLPRWDEWLKLVRRYMDEEAEAVPVRQTLRRGDRGSEVKLLQQWLLRLGYKLPRYGADGAFGRETEAAVKAFQKAKGLVVDGIVGPKTWSALERAIRELEAKSQPKPAPKPQPKPKVLYRVIAGSFADRANAEEHLRRLKKEGFDGWIDEVEA